MFAEPIRGPHQIAIAHPEHWRSTYELIRQVRKAAPSAALERCLEVVGHARTVVFEDDYYDLDYRSEFALVHSKEFDPPPTQTSRVHFFASRHSWSDLVENAEALTERKYPDPPEYLGYMILRPGQRGVVGRSMLSPPRSNDDVHTFDDNVRTAVEEIVTFFGHQLSITAVPFMEQDGNLLSCAHVTNWMCHYSAVLRHAVPRRPVAEFAALAGEQSVTRRYPSTGLTVQDTVQLLEHVDLPPITMTMRDLVLRARDALVDRGIWLRRDDPLNHRPSNDSLLYEELTAEICRHLNSGLPCLVDITDGDKDHQLLVCGYLRTRTEKGRDVTTLIYHDDQRGPYLTLPVPNRLDTSEPNWASMSKPRMRARVTRRLRGVRNSSDDDMHVSSNDRRKWCYLILPAPRGIRTTGSNAEVAAGEYVLSMLEQVGNAVERLVDASEGDSPNKEIVDDALIMRTMIQYLRSAIDTHAVSLRTYATTGVGFKVKFPDRCSLENGATQPDPNVVQAVREFPFPKYIWVVELIHRPTRDAGMGEPCVLGEVIIDASATPIDPKILLVHLPGLLLYEQSDRNSNQWASTETYATSSETQSRAMHIRVVDGAMRYHSGRPSLTYDHFRRIHGQSKGAMSGNSYQFS